MSVGSSRRRQILLFGIAITLLLGGVLIAAALNWPFTRQRLIDALQESSVRTVTLGRFRQTWFPPGCVAEDVQFLHRAHKDKPPLITIQRIVVKGSYLGLIGSPKRLKEVKVVGMHVTVPPRNPDGSDAVMPLTNANSARPVTIGRIQADGAVLDFVSKTGVKTFGLVIDRLSLNDVGNGKRMGYSAKIANTDPPGEIQSTGHFGPWNSDDPGRTPVEGAFRCEHTNLGFYKGLAGMLQATGGFSGTLDHIRVNGKAEVPDFHLVHSAHVVGLTSKFTATVNGTDGNVALDQVASRIENTVISTSGSIAALPGQKGMNMSLDLAVRDGHIQDLVDLFVSAKQAPMTGLISLHVKVGVPPGSDSLLHKLSLDGQFGIAGGAFSDQAIETPLRKLTKSGEKSTAQLPTALAQVQGHISSKDGIALLENVSFSIPDGNAKVNGTYGLESNRVDLRGVLQTTGNIYVTSTGVKAVLLRAITPFLKHESRITFVPFKITGTYPDANVSLDLLAKR
jgi:hypothetical protein